MSWPLLFGVDPGSDTPSWPGVTSSPARRWTMPSPNSASRVARSTPTIWRDWWWPRRRRSKANKCVCRDRGSTNSPQSNLPSDIKANYENLLLYHLKQQPSYQHQQQHLQPSTFDYCTNFFLCHISSSGKRCSFAKEMILVGTNKSDKKYCPNQRLSSLDLDLVATLLVHFFAAKSQLSW